MAASPVASSSSSPASPLAVQRPSLSPRKRKLSDASAEAASPTSLDEVRSGGSGAPLEERVISPKKKVKADSGDLSKWESHVVASIASALDLDGCAAAEAPSCEPIALSAAPAGDLAADELQILRHFLA